MSSLWDDFAYTLRQIRWRDHDATVHFRRVLKDEVPIEQLVQVMPRCETCAHWTAPTPPIIMGACAALALTGEPSICTVDEWGMFDCRADFGCVKWKERT